MTKISSLDDGYQIGDLSVYPTLLDDPEDLYLATNNAESYLKQSLAFNAKKIVLKDASKFPESGILRIGTLPGEFGQHELVYYTTKNGNVISGVQRGFAKTRQNRWPTNAPVISGVSSEHHNAARDAIYNIENNLGTSVSPAEESLNWILQKMEQKWLSPRPLFRAYPTIGPPSLTVRFQNLSLGNSLRFLWDFGDGASSTDRNPTHTYLAEGVYTVSLNLITETGGSGIVEKQGYITVDDEEVSPFFYVTPDESTPKAYSMETAEQLGGEPTTFNFVDQTDGDITQRFWVFDDGTNEQVNDPNIHSTTHVYEKPGEYTPSLLVVFASNKIKKAFLSEDQSLTIF